MCIISILILFCKLTFVNKMCPLIPFHRDANVLHDTEREPTNDFQHR